MFFPISWMSPFTVPSTMTPLDSTLWPLLGLEGSAGAAAALCYGAAMLLGSLPGALVLLRRPPAAAPAT